MQISETTKNQVRRLVAQNKKLEAVKLVKDEFGLSLRDAVSLVEAVDTDEEIRFNTFQRSPFPNRNSGHRGKPFTVLSKAFIGVGILLCAVAAALAYDTDTELKESQLVPGKVVDFVPGSQYAPVVQYSYNDQLLEVEGMVSSNPPAYDIGEEVGVFVPNDPTKTTHIDSITELWIVPLILSLIGLIFLFIGGVAYAVR